MKLSNNSLANQYLLYHEGEQTVYDVRQVHMIQNVSDWNSDETMANNASSEANETDAKDNITNLTLIHYNANQSKLKLSNDVLDVIKTTGGWVSLTGPDSSRIEIRLDSTIHHLPHNSTPSNTCSNPYLVMLATDLGIMIFQITSSYPLGIDTTDILNIRLRPKPSGYGERFQGNRHEIKMRFCRRVELFCPKSVPHFGTPTLFEP